MDLKHLNMLFKFGAHYFNFVDYFEQHLYVYLLIFSTTLKFLREGLFFFFTLTPCIYFPISP